MQPAARALTPNPLFLDLPEEKLKAIVDKAITQYVRGFPFRSRNESIVEQKRWGEEKDKLYIVFSINQFSIKIFFDKDGSNPFVRQEKPEIPRQFIEEAYQLADAAGKYEGEKENCYITDIKQIPGGCTFVMGSKKIVAVLIQEGKVSLQSLDE
jgi:hypothetical protein